MKRNRLKTTMTMLRYYYFISSIINKDNYYFLFMELFYNDDYKLEAIAQKFFLTNRGLYEVRVRFTNAYSNLSSFLKRKNDYFK